MADELETIRKKLYGPKPSLVINRVPENTLESFKALSNKEFNGDYGFTLKFLVDTFSDAKFDIIFSILKDHEEKLSNQKDTPNIRRIKTVGGRVIEVVKKED